MMHVITSLFISCQVHPQPETYWGHVNTIGPRACYDEGKRVAETMCYAYARQVFHNYWMISRIDQSSDTMLNLAFNAMHCYPPNVIQGF